MNDLKRFDKDGIELVINTKTGESFATISGYARMACLTKQAISKRLSTLELSIEDIVKEAQIITTTGLKTVNLITGKLARKWLIKDNPALAEEMIEVGWTVYCHQLAGYTVSSTATKKELSPLEILEQQVRLMRQQQDDLDKLKLQVQEIHEFKQEMLDVRNDTLAHFKALPQPTVAVAELKTKELLNRKLRDYAIANNLKFGEVYTKLYREFRDRYHIDLKVRGNNQKPKLSGTEYADSINMIEQLYAVASEVLI